jgi:hypothetical protein
MSRHLEGTADELTDETLINRDDLDARTNVYTLTDAGGHELRHYAETLAGLCDQSRLVGGAQQ